MILMQANPFRAPLEGVCLENQEFVRPKIVSIFRAHPFLSLGRILGRNPGKSLNSFPPCYSQSHVQLCLEISNSQTHTTSDSFRVQLLHTVMEKGGKPDRKPYPLSLI